MQGQAPRLVNLAFRVASVAEAETVVSSTPGWAKRATHELDGKNFLEASLGDVRVNFFETALYDGATSGTTGFLHASFAVPSLAFYLDKPEWRRTLSWGPLTIRGGFGHRRIAFFEPIPACRIELMEEIAGPQE